MSAAEFAEIFEDFRVEDGGTDLVDAHRPFAEVDFATAIGAEWKVFVLWTDQHAAGGAAENFDGFFLGSHEPSAAKGDVTPCYKVRSRTACR